MEWKHETHTTGRRAGPPMSDDPPPSCAEVLLRGIRDDISAIKGDMAEVKERLGLLEGFEASLSRRLDRMGGDMERIKVRLELVDERT